MTKRQRELCVHFLSGLIKWVSRCESPGCTQELPSMGTYNRESSEVGSLQRSGMDLRFGTVTNKKCFLSESGAVSTRSRVKLLSRGKWCCSCLFTCLLELHPAVLGTLSVAQIKINGFSMTAELTEHIPRAGCAARLSPTPTTPQQLPSFGGSKASLSSVLLCAGSLQGGHINKPTTGSVPRVKLVTHPSCLQWGSGPLTSHSDVFRTAHFIFLGSFPRKGAYQELDDSALAPNSHHSCFPARLLAAFVRSC
ncbi:uncharacterized protein LOC129212203 isoform X1 [Grus americana]|uniref:uncharacterized protein LOC129212203 isoform X1 n=3 Tax=Grus americana TaxID=9117 RepID=UPI0024078B41|nr:uncharacterized protein LOC129212203 isoform X1 [Grus americana]XP_054696440.1 uncharacterized protein LOC129212203 isoform X1 [Grus americana]